MVIPLAACMRSGVFLSPRGGGLELVQQSTVLDTLAREPMLVQHPNGTVFVTGYNRIRPRLWKSADLGATWVEVNVGLPRDGAIGNSDVDLAVAPDGTMYIVQLTFDLAAREGVQLALAVSRDAGATWRWSTVSRRRYVDRPWIDVTPNGTVHLIWNDGTGVFHMSSRDRGATWTTPQHVYDRGGSSHLAVGPGGALAIHIIPGARAGLVCDEGTDLIAISTDDGANWRKFPAAGAARPSGCLNRPLETHRWVDPLVFDRGGALYSLWTDSTGVWLSRTSVAKGEWTTWLISQRRSGSPTPYFPYLATASGGAFAATWVLAARDTLHWQVAHIAMNGKSGSPTVVIAAPRALESWRGNGPDAGGEYLATAFLNDRSIAVVTPIQNAAMSRFGLAWQRFAVRP